jgi:hypothetical protein
MSYKKNNGNILNIINSIIGQEPNITIGYLQRILDLGMSQKSNINNDNSQESSDLEKRSENFQSISGSGMENIQAIIESFSRKNESILKILEPKLKEAFGKLLKLYGT